MTNYNLAEFKEWLGNKDSSYTLSYQRWLTNLQEPAKWELFLNGVRFLNNDPEQYFAGDGITRLGQEWKAEVDEREREREQNQGGDPSMIVCSKCKTNTNNSLCPVCINQIITQWKDKYTNLLNSRKQKLQQEINLIKEVLND